MIKNPLSAGASRFAHFAGFARASAEDDDKNKDANGSRADEGDDEKDGKRGSKVEEDDKDKDGKRGSRADEDDKDKDAKGSRADEGDDEKDGKRGSKAEEDDKDKDAKRGSRADDDDDDDKDEMSGKSAAASARRRERARCAAIFAHPMAAQNPELACSLAFDTTQTRKEAIAVLGSQAKRAPAGSARSDRERRNSALGGSAPAPTGRQAVQGSWGASFDRVGATPRR